MSPSNGSASGGGGSNSGNYIEHPVSKMDTLVGVAIKYGVEVSAFVFRFKFHLVLCFLEWVVINFVVGFLGLFVMLICFDV